LISGIKNFLGITAVTLGTTIGAPTNANAQTQIKINEKEITIPPSGTKDSLVLAHAPSCDIFVNGKNEKAVFVIDVSDNCLYHYDTEGKPLKAYAVATGKESTPTKTGIRKISHVESYPYSKAPKHTKRSKNPAPYGKRIIFLDKVDPQTGKTTYFDEFIHGTNVPSSVGKPVSSGCIRMEKTAIIDLANIAKRGLFVLIKK